MFTEEEKLEFFKEYFRPHFDEWVTGAIGRYISTPDALVSFILIACAIDWLAGFWWGDPIESKKIEKETQSHYEARRKRGGHKEAYIGFIREFFPKDSEGKPVYDAEALYDSLRNGLVHMFTIKGRKYALTHNKSWVHLKYDQLGQVLLNSEDFFADWLSAKDKYFDQVERDPVLLNKFFARYERNGFLGLHEIKITEPD